MTDQLTRDDADDSPTDRSTTDERATTPESLLDREGVEYLERTKVHDDEDHCAVGVEGRAVVGVTDAEGRVLVAVHEELSVAMLPNDKVESGDDWAAVGRRAVADLTGVEVELDGPERVRRVDHFAGADEEPHTTSHQVVFGASPAEEAVEGDSGAPRPTERPDCDWSFGWYDEFPETANDEGPAEDDVRLFLD